MDGPIQTPASKRRFFQKVTTYAHAHKGSLIFVAALTLILSTGFAVWAIIYQAPVYEPAQSVVVPKKKEEPKFFSPLTGVQVADEAATKQQVTAIMIENSPDARPQSGLKDAGIVYETIAEGGITRFLVLYQESKPQLVGPVRSLRPYYVEWAAPYDAAIAHVGGSKFALDEVRNGSYKDIDQFFNAGAYWRASDRSAPHNVYTSFARLDALNQSKGFNSSTFTGFARGVEKASAAPNATRISIAVNNGGGTYDPSYVYNSADNTYTRSLGTKPHTDREAGQLAPKVVVAIKIPTSMGFEDGVRMQMQTSGQGQAYIFQNGTVTEATWAKTDKRSHLVFRDASGADIALNPGQVWITAIGTNKAVSWQ